MKLHNYMEFKQFLEATEEQKNIKTMLAKIPKKHRNLVRGFKYEFIKGNTLDGDDENIGLCDKCKKKLTIAGPWHYGREFTTLHEVGHLVWEMLPPEKKAEWKKVLKGTKGKHQRQNAEELFCMAYANTYAKHKDVIHDHPEWDQFIKKL